MVSKKENLWGSQNFLKPFDFDDVADYEYLSGFASLESSFYLP